MQPQQPLTRRAKKRAAARARHEKLLMARAMLALEYGDVPEHLIGLDLHTTMHALQSVQIVRRAERLRAARTP
jgi:hypothetical protein